MSANSLLLKPKAFAAPRTWETRRGTRWQNQSCSTTLDARLGSRCAAVAFWMIARSADQKGGVRYACDRCKKKRYGHLEEVPA